MKLAIQKVILSQIRWFDDSVVTLPQRDKSGSASICLVNEQTSSTAPSLVQYGGIQPQCVSGWTERKNRNWDRSVGVGGALETLLNELEVIDDFMPSI